MTDRLGRLIARLPGWVNRQNARDLWLVLISVVILWTLATVYSNQAGNTAALCALRSDLQTRVAQGQAFLLTHPHGIPGISAATIRASIANERATIRALSPVLCPAPPDAIVARR